uniref:Uncharacterized protein n=1 Tax=Toxoplasma gondii (strain ATCC 50861 / VEG) TaxID=432359 RepID=A0A0F7UV22_TOXGV|nr:TPA: hypothetical protein BN1205_088930 [Toxoplasma gondii VEG]
MGDSLGTKVVWPQTDNMHAEAFFLVVTHNSSRHEQDNWKSPVLMRRGTSQPIQANTELRHSWCCYRWKCTCTLKCHNIGNSNFTITLLSTFRMSCVATLHSHLGLFRVSCETPL